MSSITDRRSAGWYQCISSEGHAAYLLPQPELNLVHRFMANLFWVNCTVTRSLVRTPQKLSKLGLWELMSPLICQVTGGKVATPKLAKTGVAVWFCCSGSANGR